MFDLAHNDVSHQLIREFYAASKVVSAVCHGPAALVNVKLEDGTYLIAGQEVTGFSNAEEEAYNFTNLMPFLLEDEMKKNKGIYQKAETPFAVKTIVSGRDGNLVTGQNPPSAGVIGKVLFEVLKRRA